MKKIKLLIPTLSTLAIATIAISSCSSSPYDGYVSIPTDYLNIEGKTLNGLKEEYKAVEIRKFGYDKLTVPSNITIIEGFVFTDTEVGYKAIEKVDFQKRNTGLTIEQYCFSNLPELKILQFPADCRNIRVEDDAFFKCSYLTTIDFSNTTQGFSIELEEGKWASNLPEKGKFIANNDNLETIKKIRTTLGLSETDWTIEVK